MEVNKIMDKKKVAIYRFPGTNGCRDLYEAFTKVGFNPYYHDERYEFPSDVSIIGLPGGFSYGDINGAGTIAASHLFKHMFEEFVSDGGLIIGICNGYQILTKLGLLSGTLDINYPDSYFRHRWIELEFRRTINSPWLNNFNEGDIIRVPMAHGEGRLLSESAIPNGCFKYRTDVNGSISNIAAQVDKTGRVFGIMPHPERSIDEITGSSDGLKIFQSVYRCING